MNTEGDQARANLLTAALLSATVLSVNANFCRCDCGFVNQFLRSRYKVIFSMDAWVMEPQRHTVIRLHPTATSLLQQALKVSIET